jgi:hypothetical protein
MWWSEWGQKSGWNGKRTSTGIPLRSKGAFDLPDPCREPHPEVFIGSKSLAVEGAERYSAGMMPT